MAPVSMPWSLPNETELKSQMQEQKQLSLVLYAAVIIEGVGDVDQLLELPPV